MKKVVSLLLTLSLMWSFAGCTPSQSTEEPSAPSSDSSQTQEAPQAQEEEEPSQTEEAQEAPQLPTVDPSGAEITVPQEIDSVVVLAPSIAETIIALGHGDQIVACDTQSVGVEGLPEDLPTFDLMNPDMEQLTVLQPDVLFVSNMTFYDDSSPLEQLESMGTCIICVPSSDSIADIQEDLRFIASVFGEEENGEELVSQMQDQIDKITQVADTITEKKTVYFEIAAAPDMYSFGSGVFLNEMIELIGAENILADQESWVPVEAEAVVAANPDVILTNVNYLEDPIAEILSREGWEQVTAVANQDVYYIDNDASSLPNQNVVEALEQMAIAVYPDYFGA